MGRIQRGAAATLVVFVQLISSGPPPHAAPLVVVQADDKASRAPGAIPDPSPPSPPATPGLSESAPAKKSALSPPACYVKYLEAKVAGKLSGRAYVDFRRDVCGQQETTAVFPTAISPKYLNEKDFDKARKQTCADQFTANKATDANGGLKWIEKDGGYYAECVNRLKG
jgi:hypothetical protein